MHPDPASCGLDGFDEQIHERRPLLWFLGSQPGFVHEKIAGGRSGWSIDDGAQVAIIDDQNGAGADALFVTNDGRRVLLARLDGVVGAIRNPALPPCPADTDADGIVGLGDLALLLSHFGDTGQAPATGDVDDDGDVDLSDLAALLGDFGTSCQ